jgi:hypothetical protein
MAEPIVLSARLVAEQGLNIDGVARDDRGRIAFAVSEDAVDLTGFARAKSVRNDILAAQKGAKAPADPKREDARERQRLREAILKPAIKDLELPPEFAEQLAELAEEDAVAERQARAGLALEVMSRTAVIRHKNAVYIASTHDPSAPEIVAQAAPNGDPVIEASVVDTLATIAEIVFELLTGLLALLGVTLRTRIPTGRIVRRILEVIRRNRRVRRAALRVFYGGAGQSVTAFDLLTFLKELFFYGFTWECVRESLDEIVDLSFWGIGRLLLKTQVRLTPGLGQALLLADLALIAAEIGIKIARHFKVL